jgi:hypothetical protein
LPQNKTKQNKKTPKNKIKRLEVRLGCIAKIPRMRTGMPNYEGQVNLEVQRVKL